MELYLSGFIPKCRNKAGIFLCTAGEAEILVNNRLFRIHCGMAYVVSPLMHLHQISQSDDFDGFHLIDDLEVFYSIVHSSINTIVHLHLAENPCIELDEYSMSLLQRRKSEIETKRTLLQDSTSPDEKALLNRIIRLLEQETILEVVHLFFCQRKINPQIVNKGEAVVYSFFFSLHNNFKTERSVAFYAAEAHLSTSYFSAVVKQKTGQTPFAWIVAITIAHAKVQLEKSQRTIKDIAAELHFPEQFTFRKYFKQYVGMPPKQYRLQKQKGSLAR